MMTIGLVELFVILAAVVGSGGMVAVLGWLWYRTRRLEEPGSRLEELRALRDELEVTRETTRELAERLDFLERLLEAGDDPDVSTPPDSEQ